MTSQQPILQEASYEFSSHTQQATGSLKIKLPDANGNIKVKHSWSEKQGEAMGVEFSSAKWGLEWNCANNDLAIERKFPETKLGELRVRQRIQANKLYLIPSPTVKMLASPLSIPKWKLKDNMEASYDFYNSVGKVEEELVIDKRYKMKLSADTIKGFFNPTCALTAKLNKPYLISLGLNHSKSGGPVLKYEACWGEDDLVKLKADWQLKGHVTKLELQPKISTQARLMLTAIGTPQSLLNGSEKPRVTMGVKWEA